MLDVTKHNSNTMYCGSVSSDEVTVSLFVTDDDTISGTRTNLVTHFSGTSNSGTYVSVSQPAVHTATATHAGKVLFAVIETTSGGFARIDNFELIANPPSRFETWIDGFMFRNQGLTIGTISSNN